MLDITKEPFKEVESYRKQASAQTYSLFHGNCSNDVWSGEEDAVAPSEARYAFVAMGT